MYGMMDGGDTSVFWLRARYQWVFEACQEECGYVFAVWMNE
jgi:hypothetical protein